MTKLLEWLPWRRWWGWCGPTRTRFCRNTRHSCSGLPSSWCCYSASSLWSPSYTGGRMDYHFIVLSVIQLMFLLVESRLLMTAKMLPKSFRSKSAKQGKIWEIRDSILRTNQRRKPTEVDNATLQMLEFVKSLLFIFAFSVLVTKPTTVIFPACLHRVGMR